VSVAAVAPRAALLLAAPDDNIPPGKGPEWGKAAPIGLLIILLLGVALFFLIKNMNKQFRKVPESFDPPSEAATELEPDEVAPSGSGQGAGVDDPDPPNATDPSVDSGDPAAPVAYADEDSADSSQGAGTDRADGQSGAVSAPPATDLRGRAPNGAGGSAPDQLLM
jgi:hypothetical protein